MLKSQENNLEMVTSLKHSQAWVFKKFYYYIWKINSAEKKKKIDNNALTFNLLMCGFYMGKWHHIKNVNFHLHELKTNFTFDVFKYTIESVCVFNLLEF